MLIRTSPCRRGLGDVETTASDTASAIGSTVTKATEWLSSQPWYIVAALAAAAYHFTAGKGRK